LPGVWCPVFSADGRLLAAFHADATVRLYDSATGRERLKLAGSLPRPALTTQEGGGALAFSPDGRAVAAASRGPSGPLEGDRRLPVWAAASGSELGRGELPGPRAPGQARRPDPVAALAWRPDGKALAYAVPSGAALRVRLWSPGEAADLLSFDLPGDAPGPRGVVRLAFAPDGETLAVSGVGGGTPLGARAPPRPAQWGGAPGG